MVGIPTCTEATGYFEALQARVRKKEEAAADQQQEQRRRQQEHKRDLHHVAVRSYGK